MTEMPITDEAILQAYRDAVKSTHRNHPVANYIAWDTDTSGEIIWANGWGREIVVGEFAIHHDTLKTTLLGPHEIREGLRRGIREIFGGRTAGDDD